MRNAINSKTVGIRLSYLICTVPDRKGKVFDLIDELNYQIGAKPAEFLYLGDNKRRSVGQKRNDLLDIAQGEWVRFVDDDDMVYGGDVDTCLQVIADNPNKKVIVFRGTQNENGRKTLDFRFDRAFGMNHRRKDSDGMAFRGMLPNHLCIWRKDVIQERFAHINLSEDHRWANKMLDYYTEQDQVVLDKYLYHYEFDRNLSLCRR